MRDPVFIMTNDEFTEAQREEFERGKELGEREVYEFFQQMITTPMRGVQFGRECAPWRKQVVLKIQEALQEKMK